MSVSMACQKVSTEPNACTGKGDHSPDRAAPDPGAESDRDEVEERNGNLQAGHVVNPSYHENQSKQQPRNNRHRPA